MTTRLLTFASLAWATSAMAGDWQPPVAPTEDNAVQIEDLGHYYATPKGSGQFLMGGNSWGTQASLDTKGYEVVLYHALQLGSGQLPDGWSICFPTIAIGTKDYAGDFLFTQSGGTSIYCNAFNGASATAIKSGRDYISYTFTLNPDGKTYRIAHEYGGEGNFLGWDGATLGEKSIPQLAYLDPSSTAETEDGETVSPLIDWAFIPAYLYAAYDAKLKLYEKLDEGEQKNVKMDDILEVYNNPTATAEEVIAATSLLSERIMQATEEGDEVEVTDLYIKNPDCAADEGWSGFKNQTHNYPEAGPTEEGAQITGRFFEMWKSGAALDDATLKQTITVPAGKYRLQADVIASWQSDGSVAVEGVYLYANGGVGMQKSDPVSTANGVPQVISVEFTSTGEAQIGLTLEGTNANWVAVDNFKLFFQGYIDNPNEIALIGLKESLASYEDETFSAATKQAIAEQLAEIQTALDSKDEDVMAPVVEKAKTFTTSIEEEIAAYKKLDAFADRVDEDASEYAEYGSLGEWLGTYAGEVRDSHDDGTVSTAQIEEMISSYEQKIEDGVRKFIAEEAKAGTDISVLIKNRDMDEGKNWINGSGGEQLPGWSGTQPWAHDQSATEYWNMDFDFYQDIEGLPAGKYTVSFQGFYRWGSAEQAVSTFGTPDDEANIIARIYGNSVETPFKSIVNGTKPYEGSVPNGWADVDGANCMPNTMTTFQEMVALDPTAYYSEATAIVGSDGKLRIGIKASGHQEGSWVIFDSFRLRYDGNEAGMYDAIIDEQIANLIAKRDNLFTTSPMPQDIYDNVDAMALRAEEVKGQEGEVCLAFIDEISATSAALDDVVKMVGELTTEYNYYDTNMLNEASSTEFYNQMETMYDWFNGSICPWKTTDELKTFAHDFNAMFVAGVQAKGEGATEDAPYDMTLVVRNPEFQTPADLAAGEWNEEASTDYWKGTAPGTGYMAGEMYNKNFDMNQTIMGLPKGYYSVTVQGYYRQGTAQAHADSIAAGTEYLPAQLYATVSGNTWSQPMKSIFDNAPHTDMRERMSDAGNLLGSISVIKNLTAEGDSIVVPLNMCYATELFDKGYYADNTVIFQVADAAADVTIGIKKDSLYASDWTMFDHFRLCYLGQEAPTGIEAIEGKSGKAAGAVVKQAYYTIGGMPLARPSRGVNIVVTTLPDGTQVRTKVILK